MALPVQSQVARENPAGMNTTASGPALLTQRGRQRACAATATCCRAHAHQCAPMSMRTDLGPALQAEVSPAWPAEPRKPRAFRSRREELDPSCFFPLLSSNTSRNVVDTLPQVTPRGRCMSNIWPWQKRILRILMHFFTHTAIHQFLLCSWIMCHANKAFTH